MNPLKDPKDRDEATRTINLYAASDWLKLTFSDHGKERQQERVIPIDVLLRVLREGQCVEIRSEVDSKNRLRHAYKMNWTDRYGRVSVVTAIPGPMRLHIVTTHTDIPD